MLLRRALLVVLCGALAVACERKAPGPDECRTFALAMYGVSQERELSSVTARGVALREEVDELTRECLVMPYDRELLRCQIETRRTRACRVAFERRRAAQ